MSEVYQGYVITEKKIPPSVGRMGSDFTTVYVVTKADTGAFFKQFQTPHHAKHAIDLEIAEQNERE